MCLGVVYAWGVFLLPIATEFGWGRGPISLAVSILLLTFSGFMVVVSMVQRRYGVRLTAMAGGAFVSMGWILAHFTESLLWLYATYGVLAGIGTALSYMPSISAGIKWFPDKRGLVSGIVVFGFGFGAALFAPLATHLVELYGWRTTMLVLGAGFGLAITCAAQLLKEPPEGWTPPGWTPTKDDEVAATSYDFTPKETLKTTTFALMFLTFAISMVAGMMAIGHIAAFAEDVGYTAAQAALALTILAIGNGSGRIIFGAASDKMGRTNTLALLFTTIGVTMLALYYMTPLFALYAAALLIGLCFGGFLAVYPPTTADLFGTKNFGTNYGLVSVGYGTGCFIGPWLGGTIFDITGSYFVAFAIAGVLALVGAIVVYLFIKPPKTPSVAR